MPKEQAESLLPSGEFVVFVVGASGAEPFESTVSLLLEYVLFYNV